MHRILACLLLICSIYHSADAQIVKISDSLVKRSFVYAVKDTDTLNLDIYTLQGSDSTIPKPCILFVFGGAFIRGRRDDSVYNRYFNYLVENNYNVVSISYRLGMRGVQHVSKFNIAPLRNAIEMASEDVFDATDWMIHHAGALGIDTSKIILSGSSSGAITVLETAYNLANQNPYSQKLPAGFRYAGVVAFSGAILSVDWGLKYKTTPPPTLMFHGTADHIVPYKKIGFLNKGLYGSEWIAKIFQEKNYPYYLYSDVGLGHEVAVLPMYSNLPLILNFLDTYVMQGMPYQTSVVFKNPNTKPLMLLTSGDLFKKLQQQKQNP